jgi:hypothetical protein
VTAPNIGAIGAWSAGTTGGTISPTLPAHAAGDLLLVAVHVTTSSTTVPTCATPGGWALVGSITNAAAGTRRGGCWLFAKDAASAAETFSTTYTPTGATAVVARAQGLRVDILTWNDTGTITDAWTDTDTAVAADSSTLAFSGIVITDTAQLAVASVGQCDDTSTGVTNNDTWGTLGTDYDSNAGSDGLSGSRSKSYASTGTKSVTFTFTSGGTVSTFGVAVTLAPYTPPPPAAGVQQWTVEPSSFMRPAWRPDHSAYVFPVGYGVDRLLGDDIPPIPPSLPDFFARTRWNPERSVFVQPELPQYGGTFGPGDADAGQAALGVVGYRGHALVDTAQSMAAHASAAQFVNATVANASVTTSVVLAALSVTTGNAVIVTATCEASIPVTSVTDTAGNGYSLLARYAGAFRSLEVWGAFNVTGHASNVVTVNVGSAPPVLAAQAIQYSGLRGTSADAFDVSATGLATGTTTSVTTSSFTPEAAGELSVACFRAADGLSSITSDGNYTIRNATYTYYQSEDRVSCPAGSQTAGFAYASQTSEVMILSVTLRTKVVAFGSATGGVRWYWRPVSGVTWYSSPPPAAPPPPPPDWFMSLEPERYLRPRWNPERSHVSALGIEDPAPPPAPDLVPSPVAPDRWMRPIWSPERSHVAVPGAPVEVVVPTAGPLSVEPASFLRRAWRPERTNVAQPPYQTVPGYFVSTTGNDSDPGTFEKPWRHIQKAMDSAPAGATVNIRGGTYEETLTLNVSGTNGNPITFQNYGYTLTPGGMALNGGSIPGEAVTISLSYLGTVSTVGARFFGCVHRSYVNLRGLIWTGYRTNGGGPARGICVEGNSHHIEFRDCKVLDCKDVNPTYSATALALIRVGDVTAGDTHDVTFYGCEVGNVVTNIAEPLTFTSQWATGEVYNGLVENCYLHDCDQLCLDFHGGAYNCTARGNLLEYVGWTRGGSLYWPGVSTTALYCDGAHDVLFEDNTVQNTSIGILALSEPSPIPTAYNVTIRNNRFINCGNGGGAAIEIGSWYAGKGDHDMYIYNNTIVNSRLGIYAAPNAVTTQVLQNNIVAFNDTNVSNGGGLGSWDYNCFYSGGTYTGDANRLDSDPLFVNRGAGDLHLQSTSPARNRGHPSTSATYAGTLDGYGSQRFSGGRIDIGMSEFFEDPVQPMLPERALRVTWKPDHSLHVLGFVPGPVTVYVIHDGTAPRWIWPPWTGARSEVRDIPRSPSLVVVVPTMPVPGVYPESFLRSPWRPDRSFVARAYNQGTVPEVVVSAPAEVTINQPFLVLITIMNPGPQVMRVAAVLPDSTPDQMSFSIPVCPDLAGYGWVLPGEQPLLLSNGASVTFRGLGVAFSPGTYGINATVIDRRYNQYRAVSDSLMLVRGP